jgi:hypothetical protein
MTAAANQKCQLQRGRGNRRLTLEAMASLLGRNWFAVLTTGVLAAIVLVFALWAALGQGSPILRWSSLVGVTLLARFIAGIPPLWAGRRPAITSWFDLLNACSYSRSQENWVLTAHYGLTGALLAAALLIFRVLGYRLVARRSRLRAASEPTESKLIASVPS